MKNRWARWVAFLSRREDATPLAIARIIAGSTVAMHLATMAWTGVARGMWVDQRHGGAFPLYVEAPLRWIGGPTPLNVNVLLAIGILGALFLTAGAFTRAAAIATWFSWRTLTGINDNAGGSSDDLILNILFLLMLSGCGNALSVDATYRGRRDEIPAWPRWLIITQLVVMYWTTALQKVSIGWIPGGPLDALWYILQQPTWQRFSMRWLAPFYPLTQLATLVTWCFEQSAPLLLLAFWFRITRDRPGKIRAWFNRVDFRLKYLALGLVLHVGIWLAMEVGPFFNGVLACYERLGIPSRAG